MSAPLSLLLLAAPCLLSAPAAASETGINSVSDGIVLRPDTYVVDTRMSQGEAVNFTELYLDPASIAATLLPYSAPKVPVGPSTTAPSFPPTGDLLLVNERLSETEVTVSDTKIGLVHALTEAVLHDVRYGCYQVTWAYPDDSSFTEELCTVPQVRPPFPGGPTAAIYLEEGRPDRSEPEWRYGPPDRDRDGIEDSLDECPDEAGPEASFGCPDGDADRVPDYRDNCPDAKAPARADAKRSDGCPSRVFIAAKAIVITDKIYFRTNRSTIKPESYALLDEIAGILVKHDEIKLVEIAGHTDSQGRDSYNLKLSDGRAKAVADYLVDAGVAEARLQAKGYGETEPIGDNETEEGRAANRRVEFRILEQDKRMLPAHVRGGDDGQDVVEPEEGEPAALPQPE